MKNALLIVATLFMSCSFYGNKNEIVTKEAKVDSESFNIRPKINAKVIPKDNKTKILGKWYRDDDRTSYWEFRKDGKVYIFEDGILDTTNTYSISKSCGENKDAKIEFLRIVDADSTEFCSEINGINENNSGVLSLTNMQNFKVVLFVKSINIKIPK